MSRKMDSYDVAHEWANLKSPEAAGTSANMFFSGACIYSYGYHFMIARHVRNEQNEHAVLFTERTYSRTTGKHINIVASASAHLNKLFVPDPALSAEELFKKWHREIKAVAEKLGMVRNPAKPVLEIQRIFKNAERYAVFFGLEIPEQLLQAGAISNFTAYTEHLANENALKEQAEAKAKAQRIALQKKQLKEWRKFETDYVRNADGLDYLRLNKTTGQIETTQQIRFSLSAGHHLYNYILTTIANGGCKDCKERFLERYTITEINKSFIRVGCHQVTLKEIKSFAKKQGW